MLNSYSNKIHINNDLKTGWIYNKDWEFSSEIFISNLKKDLTLLDYIEKHKNNDIDIDVVLPKMIHV